MEISWELSPGDLNLISYEFTKLIDVLIQFLGRVSKKKEKYEDVVMFG